MKNLILLAKLLDENKIKEAKNVLKLIDVEENMQDDFLCDKRLNHWLYKGDSVLHILAASHQMKLIKNKKKYSKIINESNNRRMSTPLHYAADAVVDNEYYNEDEQALTINELIKLGANINCLDKNGASPLMRAIRCRSYIAVKMLLSKGADLQSNKNGTDVIKMATLTTGRGHSGLKNAQENQKKILKLLKKSSK